MTSGDDFYARLWRVNVDGPKKDGYLKPICTLMGHTNWVYETLEVSSVPDMLASASKDGTVRLWYISTCTSINILQIGDAAEVISLSNYPGGTYIVSGDSIGRIIRWNVVSGDKFLLATLPSKVNDLWLLGGANQYLGASTSKNCKPTCDTSQTSPFHDRGSVWLLNAPLTTALNYNDSSTYNDLYFVYGDTSINSASNLDLTPNSASSNVHIDSVRVIDPVNEIADRFASGSADGTTKVWSISLKSFIETYGCDNGEIRYSVDHINNDLVSNAFVLIAGSWDTNVAAYLSPQLTDFNKLLAAYTTGQPISSLRIVNESNVRAHAFVGLISLALVFTRLF